MSAREEDPGMPIVAAEVGTTTPIVKVVMAAEEKPLPPSYPTTAALQTVSHTSSTTIITKTGTSTETDTRSTTTSATTVRPVPLTSSSTPPSLSFVPHSPYTNSSTSTPNYSNASSNNTLTTAAALSTRHLIDTASYSTTPSTSPPNELRHVFSPHDTHNPVPSSAALAVADQELESLRRMSGTDGGILAVPKGGVLMQKEEVKEVKKTTGAAEETTGAVETKQRERRRSSWVVMTGGDGEGDEGDRMGVSRRWSWDREDKKRKAMKDLLEG